jgi:2-methylcitrate dehydratase PrpD
LKAAVRHVHYGAAAALEWRRRMAGEVGGVAAGTIEAITLSIYEEGRTYCGNRAPVTAIQAQFSLSYGLARALSVGDLAPDAYTAAALVDPETARLEQMVDIVTDADLTRTGRRGATLTVTTHAGPETVIIDAVPGDPDMPMSPAAVRAKFLRYVAPSIRVEAAEAIAEAVLDGALDRPVSEILGLSVEDR